MPSTGERDKIVFSIVTHVRSRRGAIVRKGHAVPRVPGRAAGAALVAAGVAASGLMCGSAAAATAATRPGHSNPPPAFARTLTVSRLSDAGPGSLRAAITTVNTSLPGRPALIRFTVRGMITLSSPLPLVSRNVTINGATAPGYAGGAPVVGINANGQAGLDFAPGSAGSRLLALAVDGASGAGVRLGASNITLDANYIGLSPSGAAAGNHGDGIFAAPGSYGNTIGENPSGKSGAVSNVISGNGGNGITLFGSSLNTVQDNRIGTNPAGTAAVPNHLNGLAIAGLSYANEIGGTAFVDSATGQANNPTGSKGTVTPVFVVPPLGNLISSNGLNGVLIAGGAGHNQLNGNFIGTTANGDAALGNGANGVWIDGANNNSLIGCTFVNNPFVYYNVVSGNDQNGLRVTDAKGTVVQGNFFGTGANNTAIVRNRLDGILVDGSSTDTQVGGVIPLGNVSAGNGRNGIEVTGRVSGFTTFNTFGGLLAFKGAAPNGRDGLLITATGGNNLVRTNVFSGNRSNGIELGGNASGVTVDPDIAGLNTKGNAVLPNGGDGLRIDGTAHGNTIGGSLRSVIPQDTFSGNLGYGVAISGQAHNNQVFSSFIGTNLLGLAAAGQPQGRRPAHRERVRQRPRRPQDAAGQPDQRQRRYRRPAAGRARPGTWYSTTTSGWTAWAGGCRTPAARS